MPRDVVALVSADDAIAAVRVHADRVHDLLRRSGCGANEAVEVTESYAFALLDAVVNAPETVVDMAGWWFGRALDLGRRLGETGAEHPDEQPTSVLAGTTGEAQVRAALAALPESERAALMLRDGYDLAPQAVAVALRRDEDDADTLVAIARLHLVARYDDRMPPDFSGHVGRTGADLTALSRLADGSLAPARRVALRRHVATCAACEEVVDVLGKGRRLTSALPIVAMPDDAREAMLARFAERATAVLPSVDAVLLAVETDHDVKPAISPLVVVAAIVLALVLGVAVAAATRSGTSGPVAQQSLPTEVPGALLSPSFSVAPTVTASGTPASRRTASASPSASATPTASATTTASRTRTEHPAIAISPGSGRRGTTITVTGSGWAPGDSVAIRYAGPVSSSRSSASADPSGGFSVTISANGLVPGDYTITASGSSGTATASFRQTS